MQRRSFLKTLPLTAGTAFIPGLLEAANPHIYRSLCPADSLTILFQGDSITDAGRARDRYYPNDASGMGTGYVHQIVSRLLGRHPDRNLRCYNRGISGNKVFQLASRWADDCLQLAPDVLSILIGVNDFWHTLNGNYDGTVEVYERDYRQLLDRTRAALPQVRLIIGEPFAVAGGTAINDRWNTFTAYRHAARRIATDYQAIFIPYHAIFAEALKTAPASYWCPDGVHPSMAGGYLMAEAWVKALGKM